MWHVSASLGFIELTEMNLHDEWTMRIPGRSFLSFHRSTDSTCFTGQHSTKENTSYKHNICLKKHSIVFRSLEGEFARSGESCRKLFLLKFTVLHFYLSVFCYKIKSLRQAWIMNRECLNTKSASHTKLDPNKEASKRVFYFFALMTIFYYIYIHRCTKRELCQKSFCFI